MCPAIVTDVGSAVNPGAGPTACVFTAPNTNVVRNAPFNTDINLIGFWRNGVTKGLAQLVSPKIVPTARGIFYVAGAGCTGQLLRDPPYQGLTPQDVLVASLGGGAAESDQLAIQSYYASLPGVAQTLKSPGDVLGAAQFTFAWPVAAAAPAGIGGQGNTLITTTVDQSTANAWYGVLGYTVDALVTAVGITGIDTSNTFIGGPGLLDAFKTHNYFADLSIASGMPCIPMFNAANKGNTNVTVVDVAAGTTVNVTLVLAEMPIGWTP